MEVIDGFREKTGKEYNGEKKESCDHARYWVDFKVLKVVEKVGEPPTKLMAELMIKCENCKIPFQFHCQSLGLDWNNPTRSLDGFQLNAPLVACLPEMKEGK